MENTTRLPQQQEEMSTKLQTREEELHRNMEEPAATREQTQKSMQGSGKLRKELEAKCNTSEMVFGHSAILSESDRHGIITYANDKLCRISQYTPPELVGQSHNILRHPDMPKALFAKLWSAIKEGLVFKAIIKNRAKDGSCYWVHATVIPVKNENGEIDRYISAQHLVEDTAAEIIYEKQVQRLGGYLKQ